jgi:hypothetical protein
MFIGSTFNRFLFKKYVKREHVQEWKKEGTL